MTARITLTAADDQSYRGREDHTFSVSWTTTKADLQREVEAIAGPGDWYPEVTIIRAGDAATVSFVSRYGPVTLHGDRYRSTPRRMPGWQANVRAITLTLEALRAVNRYGVINGRQYAGLTAIPARVS